MFLQTVTPNTLRVARDLGQGSHEKPRVVQRRSLQYKIIPDSKTLNINVSGLNVKVEATHRHPILEGPGLVIAEAKGPEQVAMLDELIGMVQDPVFNDI